MKKKKCIGFGEYEGKCDNEAGTKWTPHWCLRCDELRRAHITRQLEDIGKRFGIAQQPQGQNAQSSTLPVA